jgi:hypothetical protein
MLAILDVEGKREVPPGGKPELQQGGFDLIWDGGPVGGFSIPTSLPSMLGCYNERDKNQLRQQPSSRSSNGAGGGGSSSSSRTSSSGPAGCKVMAATPGVTSCAGVSSGSQRVVAD